MSVQEATSSAEEKDQFNDKGKASSQFFHFVRLMELFPNVHPATLHTVLNICKNDFFLATDRLLFAKRYKDMGQARKNLYELMQYKGRCVSYASCNGNCTQPGGAAPYARPQVIKLDSKKVFTRNKSKEKGGSSNQLVVHHQQQESPYTYQYKPSSPPLIPEDLSSNTTSV